MLRKILIASAISIVGCSIALAETPVQGGQFQSDPSAPTESTQVTPMEQDNAPVSPGTQEQWRTYDTPIRECIQGDSIIPATGDDLFGYLFHNNAQTDVTMSIQGWQHKQCAINFSEGTNVMYCRFDGKGLQALMMNILNADKFNASGDFAQTLSENCQATPFDDGKD